MVLLWFRQKWLYTDTVISIDSSLVPIICLNRCKNHRKAKTIHFCTNLQTFKVKINTNMIIYKQNVIMDFVYLPIVAAHV